MNASALETQLMSKWILSEQYRDTNKSESVRVQTSKNRRRRRIFDKDKIKLAKNFNIQPEGFINLTKIRRRNVSKNCKKYIVNNLSKII